MSIIDRTQSIASAGFYRLGARALAKSIGRSHREFIEPLDPETTYFHITHPKAASQWVQSILQNLYRDAVVKNLPAAGSVAGGNVEAGKFYTSLYLTREEAGALGASQSRSFFLMRDLRDSLVSLYFSLSKTHAVTDEFVERGRGALTGLSQEDGLRMLIEQNAYNFVRIQSSWLADAPRCFRFEDLVMDPISGFTEIFRKNLELEIHPDRLRAVCEKFSFERMSGGRRQGQQDTGSHLRSGKPGNWREHFTPGLITRFKELHGEHLIACGYESDMDW
jgi:lipopolysaccharide transport system ATP-binding protein